MAEKKEKQYVSDNARLMKEWDWEKNEELGFYPQNITVGSTKKVWWKCSKSHKWQATPNNRSKGQGCPYCANRAILPGFNDLMTISPESVSEWHPTKNGELSPCQIGAHSHKKVWWKCNECGYEWQSAIYNKVNGKGCPVCGRNKQGLSRELKLAEQNGSFASCYPELLKEWDYEKNVLNPQKITKNSTHKVWWRCANCDHSWATTVYHRTVRKSGCPACANKTTTFNNCIESTHPYILEKWNYEKNVCVTPKDVTAGSNKKVWWICEKGHEWQATVNSIVSGGLCPICCGQQVKIGYNDLESVNPRLAEEWHPQKNGILRPTQFTAGSSKIKIWWLCPKGHEYQATIANRVNGTGCPICDKERKTSFPEQAIYYYLSKITTANNRFLLNGRTEIDVFLPHYNIGIEYDGYYYHSDEKAVQKEKRKNKILEESEIYLIRVKEVKKDIITDTNDIIYIKNTGFNSVQNMLIRLIDRIQNITHINDFVDIDVERDSAFIYSQYIENEKHNSLAYINPTLASEWHPTKNGYIKPDMVSVSSAKKVWWKCCNCSYEWQATIDNRNRGNGCPECAKGKRKNKK